MRGLVILLLVPDIYGGFSLHLMAARFTDSPFWTAVSRQLSHAPWTGPRLWDFIMPAFVFLVGVGIHLSYAARIARGRSYSSMLGHAIRRSVALVVLGLLLTFPVRTLADDLWPYLVIGAFFPLAELMQRWSAQRGHIERAESVQSIVSTTVVFGSALWIALHLAEADYDFTNILTQLGLAYIPAFLLVRASAAKQAVVAVALLALYAAAFFGYTAPSGVAPVGVAFEGFAAHWNKGANFGAAFDLWFLNELPRLTPYLGNRLDAYTIQFVALIPTMIGGMLAARLLTQGREGSRGGQRWLRLVLLGAGSVAAGFILSIACIPIVKWLWTPSWALLSLGVCVIWLGLLDLLTRTSRAQSLVIPFVALGSNSILLYTISAHDRWRIVDAWDKLLGEGLTLSAAAPLLEACLVLFTLWLFAYALFRARLFFRL